MQRDNSVTQRVEQTSYSTDVKCILWTKSNEIQTIRAKKSRDFQKGPNCQIMSEIYKMSFKNVFQICSILIDFRSLCSSSVSF